MMRLYEKKKFIFLACQSTYIRPKKSPPVSLITAAVTRHVNSIFTYFSYQLLLLLFKKSCPGRLILNSKYFIDAVYINFYVHSNRQAFIQYIIFQTIYIIRFCAVFQKVTKMHRLL